MLHNLRNANGRESSRESVRVFFSLTLLCVTVKVRFRVHTHLCVQHASFECQSVCDPVLRSRTVNVRRVSCPHKGTHSTTLLYSSHHTSSITQPFFLAALSDPSLPLQGVVRHTGITPRPRAKGRAKQPRKLKVGVLH